MKLAVTSVVARLSAVALVLLLAAGCASYRVDTSLQPKKPAAPMP